MSLKELEVVYSITKLTEQNWNFYVQILSHVLNCKCNTEAIQVIDDLFSNIKLSQEQKELVNYIKLLLNKN